MKRNKDVQVIITDITKQFQNQMQEPKWVLTLQFLKRSDGLTCKENESMVIA